MYRIMIALAASLIFSSSSVFAQQSALTSNDIIGMFANQGQIGARAGELTVSDAHRECLSLVPSGFESAVNQSYESDYYASYRTCMATFVPFKIAGEGEAGTCASSTVTWGQCSATLPSMADGTLFSARNTFNSSEYEGFASFQCSGSTLQFVGGGCSAAVQSCESGQVVSWGATSPLWADDDPATEYVDRYGVVRHEPKGRCYARMPEAQSGELLFPRATSNEMPDPERFSLNTSVSAQRCFDGGFLAETAVRADVCAYIPKNCPPIQYNHPSGCGFSIPAGVHDDVFNSANPTPQNSVGGVEAHCWDGKWEIKSSFCEKSCEPVIPSRVWESATVGLGESCTHSDIPSSSRMAPGSVTSIDNENGKMIGNAGYECTNGTIVPTTTSCMPKGCDFLPGRTTTVTRRDGTTASCSHTAENFLGEPLAHLAERSKSYTDPVSSMKGNWQYRCEFGDMVLQSESCDADIVIGVSTLCHSDPLVSDPGGFDACSRNGLQYENGMCCYTRMTSKEKRCYMVP